MAGRFPLVGPDQEPLPDGFYEDHAGEQFTGDLKGALVSTCPD